ncbi:hypothetical protein Bache_1028 [Bacteroides helcogenes P 36-108]|uniref:Uncharacterized protein n=1 Tax=Bacteroides helcogenes (strain ATCC 35417 / DSM 20613 / JCM 6297 / CCUG 15421 / P 36-108) TaxID=693979 RepID=E6SR94_BACT6|nr:hypothetical protein Bache_1028 [Bacteroides helcogenes P 36-108]
MVETTTSHEKKQEKENNEPQKRLIFASVKADTPKQKEGKMPE